MRLELAVGDSEAGSAEPRRKKLIKPFGLSRRSCVSKRRTVAFAAIAIQSELGDDQQFAAAIEYGAIHFSLGVFKDAQAFDFVGEGSRVGVSIVFADA
jgi:hypothetical protein